MKKLCCKFSIIIPLAMIYTLLMDSITISIVELGVYWGYSLTTFLFTTTTVIWMCCSPFRESCCNGTWSEVLFNLVPVEVFSMFVFAQWHFPAAIILLILLVVIETIFVVSLRMDENKHRSSKKVHRLYKDALKRFTVLILSIVYIIPCLITIFVYGFCSPTYMADEETENCLFSEGNDAELEEGAQRDIYQNNMNLLLCFENDSWSKYTIREKITIMQRLVNLESDYLGIPTVSISTKKLAGLTLGQYSNETKKIWIDIKHLAEAPVDECIQTICHETFHSYQHYLVDNLDWESDVLQCSYFAELHSWKENQENYKNAWVSGYNNYVNQPLEITARNYAEQETKKILSYIN